MADYLNHPPFIELHEGKLDFFVSAVSANLPFPTRAGLAYSIAYFSDAGVGAIARSPKVGVRFRAQLDRGHQPGPEAVTPSQDDTLTVAIQEETSAHLYAESKLNRMRLLLCDSFPAAFEAGPRPRCHPRQPTDP